jgi:hypothetical protein
MKISRAVLGYLLTVSLGCGGSTTGPSDDDAALSFPIVVPVGSTCGSGTSAVYFIWGLSNNVRDSNARPLESVVPVGQTLRLELNFDGCGGNNEEAWTSTSPAVAVLTPDARFSSVTHFTAVSPGVTEIFADFKGPDGKVHRTYPAYCPGSIYICVSPRTPFTRVRVVAE